MGEGRLPAADHEDVGGRDVAPGLPGEPSAQLRQTGERRERPGVGTAQGARGGGVERSGGPQGRVEVTAGERDDPVGRGREQAAHAGVVHHPVAERDRLPGEVGGAVGAGRAVGDVGPAPRPGHHPPLGGQPPEGARDGHRADAVQPDDLPAGGEPVTGPEPLRLLAEDGRQSDDTAIVIHERQE
nr:hypothetical protein GCM10020093_103800 [Planobispora longispora]